MTEGVDHGGYFLRREERVPAECARADALFHADYLPAIKTVGRGGKEGVASCETGAATVGGIGGEGGIGLNLEGTDGRVLGLVK